ATEPHPLRIRSSDPTSHLRATSRNRVPSPKERRALAAPYPGDAFRHSGVLAWLNHFGLNFGAFDFAVTPAGDWVMFECNPAGEWSWIQNKTGLPIAAAVADLLDGGTP
ncbi:hypothetical protein ABZ746_22585, partial [Streptomyces sp. NPDC020096]